MLPIGLLQCLFSWSGISFPRRLKADFLTSIIFGFCVSFWHLCVIFSMRPTQTTPSKLAAHHLHTLDLLVQFHFLIFLRCLLPCNMEKAMAPHCSTLAWKIPWTEEPGRLQSVGSLRVGHDWVTSLTCFTFVHWRRKWQPTPGFLPEESQGQQSLVGCHLCGRTESDTTAATWQQQQPCNTFPGVF